MNEIEKASWNKATEFYCTTCCTKCDDCGKNECRLHRGYREGYKAAIEDIKNSVQTVIDDKNKLNHENIKLNEYNSLLERKIATMESDLCFYIDEYKKYKKEVGE